MRDINEHTITDTVVDRFGVTPDPRLRQLVVSLVRHLHGFVRDVEPTFDEWMSAIDFVTRAGQLSAGGRQEFILLSDVLGVSMLVDAINHRGSPNVTETTVLGPFYVDEAPILDQGADIMPASMPGERLYVDVRFNNPSGQPIAGARVDVWQSDSEGFYDVQRPELSDATLRGRFYTDSEGRVRFWSITPHAYPIPTDGPVGDLLAATRRHPYRPAHLHFMVQAAGFETLVTHIFVQGDSYLDSDPVFGVKTSLIDPFPQQAPGAAPDGRQMAEPWRRLDYHFALNPCRTGRAAVDPRMAE